MTCLVGTPSIEATTPARTTTRSRKEQPRTTPRRRQTSHRDCNSLRIAPGHSRLHRSSRLVPGLPKTTDIHHRLLLGKTTKWEPISYTLHHPTVHPICLPTSASTWSFHCHSCTPQYTRWSMSIDAKPLATILLMPVSWKYYTSNSVCVFIVFLQYTPNY